VLDSVEIHQDRHLWQWGYWWELEHRSVGKRVLPGIPAKLSAVPQFNYNPPPDLGQHNFEVFNGILGLSREELWGLTGFPDRGHTVDLPPREPLIYRLYEIVQNYGYAYKAVLNEKFGDGIMSAIAFTTKVDKEVDGQGNAWAVITLRGKW